MRQNADAGPAAKGDATHQSKCLVATLYDDQKDAVDVAKNCEYLKECDQSAIVHADELRGN